MSALWCRHDWSEWEYPRQPSVEDAYRYCSKCQAEDTLPWYELRRRARVERHFSQRDRIAELEAANARLDAQLRALGVDTRQEAS